MTAPEYRSAVLELLASIEPTLFLTANFNGPSDLASGRKALKGFHARLDRAILGRNWSKAPAEARSLALWLPEHLTSNCHWHGLLRLPPDIHKPIIEEIPKMWTEIVPSGQLHISPVGNVGGAAAYMTKEEHLDHLLASSEFHS